jgi:hypothetical protein
MWEFRLVLFLICYFRPSIDTRMNCLDGKKTYFFKYRAPSGLSKALHTHTKGNILTSKVGCPIHFHSSLRDLHFVTRVWYESRLPTHCYIHFISQTINMPKAERK